MNCPFCRAKEISYSHDTGKYEKWNCPNCGEMYREKEAPQK